MIFALDRFRIGFLILIGFLFFENAIAAGAGGYFLPGFTYWTQASEEEQESNSWWQSGNEKNSYTHSNMNLTLGYKTSGQVLIGLKHFQYSIANQEGDSSGDASRTVYTASGLGIGMQFGELIAQYSLLILEAPTLTIDSQNYTYQGGDGSIFDIGYFFKIKGYHFGPMFSMVDMNFKERYRNGTLDTTFTSRSQSFLFPYFALFIPF